MQRKMNLSAAGVFEDSEIFKMADSKISAPTPDSKTADAHMATTCSTPTEPIRT